MKKIMKVFVSLLVVAMTVVLVPVQQVHAEEYVFIENSHISKYKSSFEELVEDAAFSTVDSYGVTHAFGYGYFKDAESEGNAIFALVYGSDALDNKADIFVVETLTPSTSETVVAAEQIAWEILGEELVYLEFEFEKAMYNDSYLYMYAGIYDSVSGYTDYAKIKVKNPYYNVPIASIDIPDAEDVAVGYTAQLSASYYPNEVTMDKTLVWTSSDESVATVDENGVVTGVAVGSATITATSVNGKSDSCQITVGHVIEELSFEQDVYNVNHPIDFEAIISVVPSSDVADLKDLKWEISDTSVIKFYGYNFSYNSKKITTVGPGTSTVTVTTPQGVSASCVVNVDAPLTGIFISYSEYFDIYPGRTMDLGAILTYQPSNTNYDKTLTWTSSDESVATVDANGVVTGISEGITTIVATTKNGLTASQNIRVLPHVAIEDIVIYGTKVSLFVGEEYTCHPRIEPWHTTMSQELTWVSSNEKVATVNSDGVITGVGSGSCTITATSVNGVSTSIEVTVSEGATRIFGDNRYETAFKVADTLKAQLKKDKFSYVIVASGTGFADALAGSYLSAKREAPILMTDKKQANINKLVSYINENLYDGGTVYILGGYAAVSEDVDDALSKYNVKRLAGNNRYETNMEIIDEVITGKYTEELLVCTATNFADSLSVSATGLPIMLVGNNLTEAQREFIATQSISDVYIIGGEAAVSKKIAKQIDDALPEIYIQIAGELTNISADVIRIAGNSRYETSTKVAEQFFPNADKAVLAYAKNYPDGLSGGALAYSLNAPLLLTDGVNYNITSKHTVKNKITGGFVLGGNQLVTDNAVRSIFGIPSDQVIESK